MQLHGISVNAFLRRQGRHVQVQRLLLMMVWTALPMSDSVGAGQMHVRVGM